MGGERQVSGLVRVQNGAMNNPLEATIVGPVVGLWTHGQLIWQLVKREVLGRYRGSVMGIAWSLLNPLLMLAVYTFVFSTVFKARWSGGDQESTSEFAIILFVGLIVYALFSECVNRAPGLILSNANYVKKVVFPLEILPWVALGAALFHAIASSIVLVIAMLVLKGSLPWTIVLFPIVILPLIFITMGFAWFLSATGVYVRDIGQSIGLITNVLMFLSPIFYPVAALPKPLQAWTFLNPLAYVIEESRQVLIWGRSPDWLAWGLHLLVGFLIAYAGYWWFQKTRKGFADVL
jgi:lipopolysaccharide transport system permease protein